MGAYGSITTGYDPGYLLRESSKGAEGYYLSAVAEIGEPPGVWTGRACPSLGLAGGGEVEPRVMERIYGALLDPRDPLFADPSVPDEAKVILGKPPRKYKEHARRLKELLDAEPGATPERVAEIKVQAAKETRSAVMFLDFTFSADKTTSVLHAALQAAAGRAEREGLADAAAEYARQAGIVENAVRAGSAAALEYLQDEAGYSRAGYHSGPPKDENGRKLAAHGTGRWVDAHAWIIASFLQHTSRDNDPQLHVHNAVLNRVECENDGAWRTIDGRAVHRARAAASAIGGRVMDEMVSRELGALYEQRPDGHGRELDGVSQQVKELFSSRRAVITRDVAELAAAYEERHGRPPNARALFSMAQFATLNSRHAKPKRGHAPTRKQMLDAWAKQVTDAELGALDGIPARVVGARDPATPGIAGLAREEIDRVLSAAIADVQGAHAVWSRSQLLASIDAHLPGWLGGLDVPAVREVLEDLTGQALDGGYGAVSVEATELVPVPAALVRADGRSVYSPHDRGLFTTRPHLDAEERLLDAAGQAGGPKADPAAVAAALGADTATFAAMPGRVLPGSVPVIAGADPQREAAEREFAFGLRPDQAAAVFGVLTSGRGVDNLIGPAGSGKSRTMGALADLWQAHAGGSVTGVSASENAAQVLAAEGVDQAYNIAKFLTLAAHGRARLRAGDLLIVDEAAMVPTADIAALHAITSAAGAKLLLTGDPAQLPAVGAGGALAMLAREHGHYQLTQVQRMEQEWEREASLRLRDGDANVLADYDRHGRVSSGSAEQAGEQAYRGWLADHLAGRDSLLIAAGNAQAADLSARARAELAALGLVEQRGQLALADGNTAGIGDIVQARRNRRDITDDAGRRTANRDVWRIDAYAPDPDGGLAAVAARDLGRDADGRRRWSGPITVPAGYLASCATLGYAATAHASQGRTVDVAHAVITSSLDRALLYVAMTRGRQANYAYAVTEPGGAPDVDRRLAEQEPGRAPGADLRPGARPAPALETPGREADAAARDLARARAAGDEGPWAPEATAIGVLAACLEREPGEVTALDALRDDAERAQHMAYLSAVWTDLAERECERRYDALLAGMLSPADYQRLQAEPDARGALYRQVRSSELAGWHAGALLGQAVRLRALDDPGRGPARSVAAVLHGRITGEIPGATRPARASTWAQRTPPAADPAIGAYMSGLAAAMGARTAQLGERAAARPPRWAARLGPPPADPAARAAWVRRAGAVAAWREMHGHTDPDNPIGREPAAPEARAAWRTAAAALGLDGAGLDLAARDDGELHAARAAWERELAWAPPYAGDRLRETALAAREAQREAVIARHRAQAFGGPQDRDRAAQLQREATVLARRVRRLEKADAARAAWYQATTATREAADAATAELARRHPADGPLPYRDPRHREEPAGGPRQAGPEATPAGLAAASFPGGPLAPYRPGRRPPGPQQPPRRPPEPPGRGPSQGR